MDDNEVLEYNHGKIKDIDLSSEMRNSFLSYAMSVIVARALPDVRDGLKPVHRRILWGMNELHVYPNSPHKKSARIVGEVMGKYHPHGDSSIYEAMVRMAQDFSYRYPLVDGHGNFGSIDGDGAAAMRYTEARMSKISLELLKDIDKNTVDFMDNYDATESEPAVLPAKFPNLLVNGATGIAVGMATNIPPHNLGEIIDGAIAVMDNPDIDVLGLMQYIKGPDFPTGGKILGYAGLVNAYTTGNGQIVIRSNVEIHEGQHGKNSIIVTAIPYQVNKAKLIERIAEIAKEKIVEGITDLRDESSLKGMRIVIELRRDVNPHVMLNNLYKYTQLQVGYGINMIALVNGEPKKLSLKDVLVEYLKHQFDVLTRRIQFDLDKALERLHIVRGYIIALDNIDEIINIIRNTIDGTEKEKLIERFDLSDRQAQAILDMQLKRLSGLNREKTEQERDELERAIADYRDILASEERKHEIIRNELNEVKEKYSGGRQTEMDFSTDIDIDDETLIPEEDVVITITNNGYAKRMTVDSYKTQNRGGTGHSGIKTNEDDFVMHSILSSTHDYLLFFTNKGRVYKIKGYKIPVGSKTSKGIPIVNIIDFEEGECLAAVSSIKDFDDENSYLFFATKKGIVKRTRVTDFKNIRSSGIIAISLKEDDELLSVEKTNGEKIIILGASNGKAIKFKETDVTIVGRSASGVRGMSIGDNEKLVGMSIIDHNEQEILVVTDYGYGKRSLASDYRDQTRGGKGVKTLNITDKNGSLNTLKTIKNDEDLIITTNKGIVIRMSSNQIPTVGRATQGVRLIKLHNDQLVSTVTLIESSPFDEEDASVVTENIE